MARRSERGDPSGAARPRSIEVGRTIDLARIAPVVLVVGGTGMLAPAVHALLGAARTVLLVARRASRMDVQPGAGRLVPVDADWASPDDLARRVGTAGAGLEIGAAVLWVHRPHRDPVLHALSGVLPAQAVIVRVWGSSTGDPRSGAAAALRPPGLTVREVFLGSRSMPGGGRRWLTHEEISVGTLRALASGDPVVEVGEMG